MGIALERRQARGRHAVAGLEYHNLPAGDRQARAGARGTTPASCPRRTHYTGDIRIHDIAYAGGELWIVATRFSCLATLDEDHSFVPRWRPPFVTALAAEDRCHLNGLAVIDDEPRYVTALGETDDGRRLAREQGAPAAS